MHYATFLALGTLGAFLAPPAGAQWKVVPLLKSTELLDHPTCMDIAPDGRIFITERFKGRVRIYDPAKGLLAAPFTTVPNTFPKDERGLVGIAIDKDFRNNPYVYIFQHYNVPSSKIPGRVIRYTAVGNVGGSPKTLIDGVLSYWTRSGGYLSFGPDGKLYVSVGDIAWPTTAQNKSPTMWNGKIHRINRDGTIPKDNPFGSTLPFYCLGIRNGFGLTWHPILKILYETENGPTTNDEIQIIRPGGNYGWPAELGNQGKPGYDKPIYTWTPTISPTGPAFCYNTVYPLSVQGALWVGDYNNGAIRILHLTGNPADKVVKETLIKGMPGVVDVRQGIDGKMYVLAHNAGQLYRIDWTGPAPKLPDLSLQGETKVGNLNILLQRGKPKSFMILMIGSALDPALKTPWGMLGVFALLVDVYGPADPQGVLGVRVPIPNDPKVRGARMALQSLELTSTLQGRLTNRIMLQVR